jgi:hypothetical protein
VNGSKSFGAGGQSRTLFLPEVSCPVMTLSFHSPVRHHSSQEAPRQAVTAHQSAAAPEQSDSFRC